ncbi:pyridoxamine 5'-phosphate oxidase [Porphyromonas somerae]|uniref:pyridoxamine 5'-phosphate oxidase n=1 Tax=Porphyromonas somerae TaxID=322095 RepID=UPI002A90C002|nr:pyridoxamine 5'-phosphate oxidase [Porphyromonas somerae]MDY5816308.1 pyridoxamine 5'-phosphate oxidase [Porphyromonas somerae]
MDIHVEDIRRDYKVGSLSKKDMPTDPIKKMEEWLEEAIHQKVIEPTAIIVATSTPDGHPSTRTVLLKELKDGKVIFYSNYESRKGQQILANPHVSVTFLWHQLERQIHVEGICQHVAPEVSDAYFSKRPYMSRVGARISPQSHPIPSRAYIVAEFAKESLKYTGTLRRVPRPDTWGGFEVTPNRIEFWQGRESRLHDRFLYELQQDGIWSLVRLAP